MNFKKKYNNSGSKETPKSKHQDTIDVSVTPTQNC